MRTLIACGIAAALFTCVGLGADDELARQLARMFPPGTVTDEQLVRAAIFEVKTLKYRELSRDFQLTDAEHSLAQISTRKAPQLQVDIDRGPNTIGIEIVDTRTHHSLLSVGKRDSGTRLDWLRYTTVDDAGNPVLEVVDYEMDGQPDWRMHYGAPGDVEIWHVDRWLRVQRTENGSGVYIDGQFRRVVSEDGRLHVESR